MHHSSRQRLLPQRGQRTESPICHGGTRQIRGELQHRQPMHAGGAANSERKLVRGRARRPQNQDLGVRTGEFYGFAQQAAIGGGSKQAPQITSVRPKSIQDYGFGARLQGVWGKVKKYYEKP